MLASAGMTPGRGASKKLLTFGRPLAARMTFRHSLAPYIFFLSRASRRFTEFRDMEVSLHVLSALYDRTTLGSTKASDEF